MVKRSHLGQTASVLSMNLEAIIGEMGTDSKPTANEGVLATVGEEITALFVRVLQDEAWREELWERFGRPAMHIRESQRHYLRPSYLETLKDKALEHLLQWSKSREEPLRSVVNQVRREKEEERWKGLGETYWNLKVERRLFLRACADWHIEGIQSYLANQSKERPVPIGFSRAGAANFGWSIAWNSCCGGEVPPEQNMALDFLLSQGANINDIVGRDSPSVFLHRAAEHNDLPRVRWLVEHGARVHAYDNSIMTPFMYASLGDGLL